MIRSRHSIGRGLVPLSARIGTPAVTAEASARPCPHPSSSVSGSPAACSSFEQHQLASAFGAIRLYTNTAFQLSSPFGGGTLTTKTPNKARNSRKRKFIPRKAAVALTPKARTFFKSLLENVATNQSDKGSSDAEDDPIIGVQLTYSQSTTGEPRMVFGFSFLRSSALDPNDEAVSLEVLEDGETPKSPAEALDDGLPKLYVHHDAVLKVLGSTLDVDEERLMPILYDKEGNVMDPNA